MGKMRHSSAPSEVNKCYKIPNNNLPLELIFDLFPRIRQVLNFIFVLLKQFLFAIRLPLRPNSFYFILTCLIMSVAISIVLCLRSIFLATTCDFIFPVLIHFYF